MLPKDVAGIFSRFFISGFFVPSFTTLFVLWVATSKTLQPASLTSESKGAQLLVLGGFALLIGLVLQGVRFPVIQIFEGYGIKNRLVLRPLYWVAMPLQRWSFNRTKKQSAWLLDRRFPEKSRLLPTRFGNAFCAYEDYAYTRWGVDMIAIWPRVDSLLTEREAELQWNAYTDVMFFVNSSIGAVAVGLTLIANEIADPRLAGWQRAIYVLPFLIAYVAYRFAIGAAQRLGTERRSGVDLHRLEVYRAIGIRDPLTYRDERENIGPVVTEFLLRAEEIPDSFARPHDEEEGEDSPGEPRPRPAPKPDDKEEH